MLLRAISKWLIWGQIAAGVGFVGAVIGVWDVVTHRIEDRQSKRDKFDSLISGSWRRSGSDFMGMHNFLINQMPEGPPDKGSDEPQKFWSSISNSWVLSMATLSSFYAPAAQCLSSGECLPGKASEDICFTAAAEVKAYQKTLTRLKKIPGITLDFTVRNEGDSRLPSALIHNAVVTVPSPLVLETFFKKTCSK